MTDVLGYIQSKGLNPKRSDANNVHFPCIFCGEAEGKRGRLYLNVDPDADIPGLFKCFLCDTRGSLVSIKKHFGDPIEKEEEHGEELFQIFKVAASYYHEQLGENEEAFTWLRGPERGLELQTIVSAQLGYANGGLYKVLREAGFRPKDILATGLVREDRTQNRLVDSLQHMVTIPYFVAGNCVGIRGRAYPYDASSNAPKYKTCGGTKSRLYNSDAVWDADEITVAEGELDCFSEDTELLTRDGWVALSDYIPGTSVVQYEEGGALSLVEPLAFVRKEVPRTLALRTEKRGGIDLVVTPMHRMVSTKPDGSDLIVRPAEDGPPAKNWHVPRVGTFDGTGIPYGDDEIRLLLAIAADATIDYRKIDGSQYVRFGFTKQRKVDRLEKLCAELGIDRSVSKTQSGWSCCFRVPNYLWAFKEFPAHWLTELSLAQRQLVLSEMVHWDGNRVVSRSQTEFSSASLGNATWMQTVAHTAGYVATLMRRKNKHGSWFKVSVLHEKKSTSWQAVSRSEAGPATVACVEVPSGMLIVRRNNEVVVSGNCLTLQQLGVPAVAVPGARNWQDSWDGYVKEMRRIWLVFDNDTVGREGSKKLKDRFGAKVKEIRLAEEGQKVDVTDWVANNHTVDDWEQLKQAALSGGLLVTVDEALVEHTEIQGLEGLKFGHESLDHWITPGLLPAQVMVVLAKTGCLAGDTEIAVNRAGKGFKITIEQMYNRWTPGNRYTWDQSIPTFCQRADNGVVRLGRVDEVWQSGEKEVYELTTNTGRKIRATDEHPFLTPSGWQKLGELVLGDEVLVNRGRVGVETIVNIEHRGLEMTYDISMVDEPHNFMANGFVVHNTGKTLHLLNTMHQMRMVKGQENLKFLFVSLEQTRGEWFERARRIHRFYNINSTDQEALSWWRDNLLLIDKNRLTETELSSALDDYEYRMGAKPDVVMVDYLGYWARAFKGEAYQRTSDAIMTLKAVAKERRVPIITPHQVSRIAKFGEEPDADAARDAGVIEETADFLFILWRPDALLGRSAEEKSGVVHMKIGKSRHGGSGVKLDYQFAPISLAMVPIHHSSDARLLQRARNELRYERDYSDKWEQAVYRHRTGFEGHLEPNPSIQERLT